MESHVYLAPENLPNAETKLFKEFCGFYLAFFDTLQLPFEAQNVEWGRVPLRGAEREFLPLWLTSNNAKQSRVDLVHVKCPHEETPIEVRDIINLDCSFSIFMMLLLWKIAHDII